MAAPALVLLANGTAEPYFTVTMHALRKRLQCLRPDLAVNIAFATHCRPNAVQVVSALIHRGASEVVLVPIELTAAISHPKIKEVLTRVRLAHPQIQIAASRPIGPAVELLQLLDERVRESLRVNHATQIDGLVLAASDTIDLRGISLLRRRVRQWGNHHNLPCLIALNDGTGAATANAVAELHAQGRRNVAVGSLWVCSDEAFIAQAKAGLRQGALAVSAPFGCDDRLLELALARYAYAAMGMLTEESAASASQLAL